MSIAECYVIDVQCDGLAHGPAFIPRDQFTGNNKRAAMASLRDCGWKLGPNYTAYCRKCKVPAPGVQEVPHG